MADNTTGVNRLDATTPPMKTGADKGNKGKKGGILLIELANERLPIRLLAY